MRYKFFTNSEHAWQAMFEAIQSAQESIYLEMYIFANDMVQYDFLSLLKEKARNGLRVRMVLDSLGSAALSNDEIASLREMGAEVLFQSYFFYRTHRKIIVVDEILAFIGGVNLSEQFRFWNDLVVEVTGKRLVYNIIRTFAKVYIQSGGLDEAIVIKKKPVTLDKTRSWLIEHLPFRKKRTLKKIYKENIREAKEKVTLVTPYFAPKRFIILVLHQAVLRGVRVDILVPHATDGFIRDRVNYFYMFKVAKLGVNFYIAHTMNHAKLMLIDSKEGIVGSQNLDFLSFDLNNEIGVVLKDAQTVKKLSTIVEDWKKDSSLFDYKTYKPMWFDYIISPFLRIFSKIL